MGKCEGSRLLGGTRLAEEHHEPGPLPPFEPGPLPPFEPGPLPPFEPGPPLPARTPHPVPLWEGARGKGSRLERGVPARGFLELWAVWAWEYHEPGPPNEPGRLVSPDS